MKTNKKSKINIINIWQNKYNLNLNTIYDIISKNMKISKKDVFIIDKVKKYFKIIWDFKKIKKGYPIEYLLKNANFYWLNFFVKPWVLIPRNDTEIMVNQVINKVNTNLKNTYSLIDIWTWSSCILTSITKNCTNLSGIYWIDISRKALRIAKKNIKIHNLKDKIKLKKWSLLSTINKLKNLEKNLIITANLPYIKDKDYINMDKSVIKYEPKIALYWWKETWFELYEKLIMQCLNEKDKYNIVLFIEIWFDQYMYSKFFLENLWLKFEYYKDFNNINRLIKIYIN